MLRRARCRRMDIGLHPQVRRLRPTSCRDDLPSHETQASTPGKTHPHATQRQNLRHSPANPSGRARNQSRLSSQIKHLLDLHPPLDRPCFAKETPSKCSDVRDAGVWISASIRRAAASARPPAETISQARDPSMAFRPRKDPPPRHATPKTSPQPRQSLRMRP